MKKTPALTLDLLTQASNLDALPTLAPLLAEQARLTTERDHLVTEVDGALKRMSRHPAEFDRLTATVQTGRQRVERLGGQIAELQQRILAERERLTAEIDALRQPVFLDVVARLTSALERVAPIDQELRDLESLFQKFIPFHGTAAPRRTPEDLRQLARYVEQQVH